MSLGKSICFFLALHLLLLVFSLLLNVFSLFFKYFPNTWIRTISLLYYLMLLRGIVSSPVRYSYLTILPEGDVGIFAPALLVSYCNFSLILSLMVMTVLFTSSNRFFQKRKAFFDGRVVSMNKNVSGFCCTFILRLLKFTKANIRWIINDNLLKLWFVLNFHFEKMCSIWSDIFWYLLVWLCDEHQREMFNFLSVINNSVTTKWSLLLILAANIS